MASVLVNIGRERRRSLQEGNCYFLAGIVGDLCKLWLFVILAISILISVMSSFVFLEETSQLGRIGYSSTGRMGNNYCIGCPLTLKKF